MSARHARRIMGLADAHLAVASSESMIARALSPSIAALRGGCCTTSGALQPCSFFSTAAAPQLSTPSGATAAAVPLTSSGSWKCLSTCSITAVTSDSSGGRLSRSGSLLPAAARTGAPQQSHMVHNTAASAAAQAAPVVEDAFDGPLASAPGDPELTDMIEPEFLETPGH